jgi:hypothetical protein
VAIASIALVDWAMLPKRACAQDTDPKPPTSDAPSSPESATGATASENDVGEPALSSGQVELEWIAPEECSRHDQVLNEVIRLIRPVKEPKPVRVKGTVTHEDGSWSILLDFEGSVTGTRSFSSSECESLTAAAAVIIALAINEERPLEKPLPEPAPPAPKEEPKPIVLPPEPKPEPPKPQNHLYLGLGGSLETGFTPAAFGPFASLGFHRQELRGDLIVGGQPQRSVSAKDEDVRANLSALWFGARGCRQFVEQSIAVFGCASFRLGRLTAEGEGTDVSSRQNSEWVSSILPGLLLRWPARTALGLELGLESSIPLTRPRVVILREGTTDATASSIEVYRVEPIGVAARAAVSFNLLSL